MLFFNTSVFYEKFLPQVTISFYTPRQLWNHYLYLYILPNSVLPFVEILPGSNRIPMELLQNYFYGQLFHIRLYGVSLS